MADLGLFRAAGFVDSLRKGREEQRQNLELGLRERGLKVQESQLDINRELATLKAKQAEMEQQVMVRDLVNKQVDELVSLAEDAQKTGLGSEWMAFLLSETGQKLIRPVEAAIQQAGLGIDLRSKLTAKLLSTADPAQVAANEGLKAGATTGATRRAELAPDIVQGQTAAAASKAGAETSARVAAETSPTAVAGRAKLAGAEAEAREAAQQPEIQRLLRLERNALETGDETAASDYRGRIDSLKASQVFDPRTKAKISGEANAGEVAAAANLTRLGSLLGQVKKKPGVAGARGSAAETVGGWLGQITSMANEKAGKSVEDAVASFFSDATPEEVNRFRVEARAQVSAMLPAITQENSRFSDAERKLARETARLMESEASAPQVVGALKTMMRLEMAGRIRADQTRAQFGANKLDLLKSEDDQLRIAREMMSLGLSDEEAASFVEQMVNELKLVK